MDEQFNVLLIFIGFLFLDIIGISSFTKPIHILRFKRETFKLKSILTKKYFLGSLIIEIVGLGTLVTSFFLPWAFQHFLDINFGHIFRYFYFFRDLIHSNYFLQFITYYIYIISLVIIFVKLLSNIKINAFLSLIIIKLILFIPGMVIIFNYKLRCPAILIPETFCVGFGYTSGMILYLIGITFLTINGFQVIFHSRFKEKSK